MRRMFFIVLIVVVLALPQAGVSQDFQQAKGRKSVATAVALGVGATLLPFALGEGGQFGAALGGALFLVGPSAGLFYAGAHKRGLVGIGVRTAIIGIGAAAVGAAWDNDDDGAAALALLAIGGLVASYIADFGAIAPAVRKYNANLSVAPMVGTGGQMGLQVRVGW